MKTKVLGRKTCPICNSAFDCNVGTDLQCLCSSIDLTHEKKNYLKQKFQDCICADCLRKTSAVNA
ncbi:MAG TPA: cysteine-rich CWC family protein [Leptospiraceae bacterium]|nr:cysteine-rich CWC family protein [Leptospiraceae bacterium]HMX32273.1 cysteine-rich CWC family protein [Leptospiraceae bacterium]HMY33441.1 cysteine-rich CWC family protein [Leptospiraceae bacterium]HMZ65475.1 cysteine-rich CWC family protein [Leptospiraceae bacterium]HNA09193.1 cysteine-rich CWC family protein [Leptospiraceae bacterium]